MEDGSKLSSINAANQLQSTFDSAHLRIRDVQTRFNSRTLESGKDSLGPRESGSFPKTPDALAAEVADNMVRFFRSILVLHYHAPIVFHASIEVSISGK